MSISQGDEPPSQAHQDAASSLPSGAHTLHLSSSTEISPAKSLTFLEVGNDLDRLGREWGRMVRLLEQNQQQLSALEVERDAAYAELERIFPIVAESSGRLNSAVAAAKAGEPAADLAMIFTENSDALDRLETVAIALVDRGLRFRSAWEQYVRSIMEAQRLRAVRSVSVRW